MLTTTVALKPNIKSSLFYVLYFLKYAFSSISLKFKNLHYKNPRRFASLLRSDCITL